MENNRKQPKMTDYNEKWFSAEFLTNTRKSVITGLWRSLVAHVVRDDGVPGSIPSIRPNTIAMESPDS